MPERTARELRSSMRSWPGEFYGADCFTTRTAATTCTTSPCHNTTMAREQEERPSRARSCAQGRPRKRVAWAGASSAGARTRRETSRCWNPLGARQARAEGRARRQVEKREGEGALWGREQSAQGS
ncbi:uncharacterized protein LOC100383757 [Zea mays]|uniref:Uncharacterized protein n=1 Tax=Zea mays TaxID=4577 RepID=C0PIU5_MAIZE|nr:uncharacterized protein LOC100383757 [Zea mays]ACN35111.1 unknown [Zea mays]|eukprot:NP_001169863.1 uncharacterized protein LOC100383757 [Zea mays]